MSVSTRLRTDTSTMYDYSREANQLSVELPSNVELQQDNLPTKYPFVPRICEEKGYFLIWFGSHETDADLVLECLKSKEDSQWVKCSQDWMVEKGVVLLYPYDDEIIIGSVKVAGYMNIRPRAEVRKYIKMMWKQIITTFGDKRIVCPAGSYLEYLHLSINQKKIPHDAYLSEIMLHNGFVRHEHYWVRGGSNHNTV